MKLKHCTLPLLLALPLSVLIAGCDRTNQNNSTSMPDTNSYPAMSNTNTMPDTNSAGMQYGTNATMMRDQTNMAGRDVNNSGINQRDRDTNNLTPGDQGNTPEDIDLTQKIRKSLVMDTNSNFSMTAKNVKIITVNGKVTLRGPVNSDSEKSGIETLAKNIAGDANVDDQLEVKANP